MIYDCFLFNDELDLLELRLSYLDKTVDHFVLVESERTLSGQPKPLHFQINRARFSNYLHKIIHVVAPANDMPPWDYEYFQRNCIKNGLASCEPGDLVVISDADEIVNLPEVLKLKSFTTPALVELPMYYYYFNLRTNAEFRVNLVAEWSFIKDRDLGNRNEDFPRWARYVIPADEFNTGWHFSYCYGNEIFRYQSKIRSFSHQEYNSSHYLDPARIGECIRSQKDIFERDFMSMRQEDNGIDPLLPFIRQAGLSDLVLTRFTGNFSVILPNYNHEKFLKERIDSIMQQEHSGFELIFLDDGSTDNSHSILESYSDSRISEKLYNKTTGGSPFKQWVKGIKAAKHDYIWIAESDDVAEPRFLSAMAAAIRKDPTAGIFYCDSKLIGEKGNPPNSPVYSTIKNNFFQTSKWDRDYRLTGWNELNEHLKFACTINNASACIFRKDLLLNIAEELGSWKYHGDWFAYTKLTLSSPIHYLAAALNRVRSHSASLLAIKSESVSRLELFRLLQFLLKQKRITGKEELIRFFTDQYLGVSFRKDGMLNSLKTIALYGSQNFLLSIKVAARIIQYRFTRKKVKPVF